MSNDQAILNEHVRTLLAFPIGLDFFDDEDAVAAINRLRRMNAKVTLKATTHWLCTISGGPFRYPEDGKAKGGANTLGAALCTALYTMEKA
jgi:hypothetical protein